MNAIAIINNFPVSGGTVAPNIALAYGLLRLALGLNILLHGIVRWRAGRWAFGQSLMTDFANTPLPSKLVLAFGQTLPIAETLIGGLLVVGLFTLPALVAGTGLLIVLLFGTCLRADWPTATFQMVYVALYTALIGLIGANRFAIDSIFTV